MPFDLSVTISMHFFERCQTKERFEISDLRRESLHLRSVCLLFFFCFFFLGGWAGTLIFSCIHRLGLFLGVQDFEFQYFWGFSEN